MNRRDCHTHNIPLSVRTTGGTVATGWLVLLSICGLLFTTSRFVVLAYPSGPGACPAGLAATEGGHEAPDPMPTFQELGYEFLINQQAVSDPAAMTLKVGTRYEIAVKATKDPFRGVLIRFDGLGEVTPGSNAQEAEECTTAPGIGHFNKLDKTILSGFYEPLGGGFVTVDITMVKVNRDGISVYSYQQFKFTLETLPAKPTKAPVPAPTKAPVRAPTKAPFPAPTKAPVRPPTKAPVPPPTKAPVAVTAPPTTPRPTLAKVTDAPTTKAPSPVPMVPAPTEAPSVNPEDANSIGSSAARFWRLIVMLFGDGGVLADNVNDNDNERLRRYKKL